MPRACAGGRGPLLVHDRHRVPITFQRQPRQLAPPGTRVQSGLADLGQDDGDDATRSTRVHRGQHDLVAQEPGEPADLPRSRWRGSGPPCRAGSAWAHQSRRTALSAAAPGRGGRTQPGPARSWGGGEDHGFFRQEAQEPARSASRGRHRPQPLAKDLHLGQEREVAVHVRAPRDLLAQRHCLHAAAGGPLIAGRGAPAPPRCSPPAPSLRRRRRASP